MKKVFVTIAQFIAAIAFLFIMYCFIVGTVEFIDWRARRAAAIIELKCELQRQNENLKEQHELLANFEAQSNSWLNGSWAREEAKKQRVEIDKQKEAIARVEGMLKELGANNDQLTKN